MWQYLAAHGFLCDSGEARTLDPLIKSLTVRSYLLSGLCASSTKARILTSLDIVGAFAILSSIISSRFRFATLGFPTSLSSIGLTVISTSFPPNKVFKDFKKVMLISLAFKR